MVKEMKVLRPSVIRANEWYKERNPVQWAEVKQQVLIRDQFTCVYCRYCCKKFMQVNHIGAEDDHRLENLETVCRACHSVLHLGISAMHGVLSIFECTPEGANIAPIVCVTRSLVGKMTSWAEIEQHILARFARSGGKVSTQNETVGWANSMLHNITSPNFRAFLPDNLAVMFHEEGEWHDFPESVWKWQCLPGSGYRKS